MFHSVYNTRLSTIKHVQYVLHKRFKQYFSPFVRQGHESDYSEGIYRKISEKVCRSISTSVDVPMHSSISIKSCYVTTLFKQRQLLSKFRFVIPSILQYATHCINPTPAMALKCFKGHTDRYNGITVNSNEEYCEPEIFAQRLTISLQGWIKDKKRTIWFRVYLPHSEWVPILVKERFKFHHARDEYVTLYRWLVTDEECNVPHYAHTILGVGAFVFNEKTKEILVVKEKYTYKRPFWKLPGGYVDPDEDLETAVKREVLEETGIETTLKCLIGFRHAHNFAFNCSDIYIIFYLIPNSFDIKKCDKEISECQWMKLTDYLNHSEVHANNKLVARKMLEFFEHKMGVTINYTEHPTLKKPIAMYTISKVDEAE
ncbi:uncharacterized protein LOC143259741 [Megalopta genalis]|uniref:uncharacterized protein LOC143259741 n=1 Tax=Megalopta genalis TaxID=115081 RepID=UPI003FD67482